VINRLTKSIVSIDIRNDGDGRHSIIPIKWSGDKFLASIQSNDLGALLNELDEYRLSFKEGTTLEEIESSENPVLMWVKFKDLK
jgi:hypothetical protein